MFKYITEQVRNCRCA